MSIRTWVGSAAGTPNSWNDPLNWSGNTVPVDGDDVVINHALNEPTLNVGTASLTSLTVNTGADIRLVALSFIAAAVTNAGTITGTNATNDASGVRIISASGSVTNSGTITGTGASGDGVDMRSGGLVTNGTSGAITGGSEGVQIDGASGTVTNAGSITGTSGIGVLLSSGGLITNDTSGTIKGGTAGIQSHGALATVTNAGTIDGTGPASIGVLFSDDLVVFNNTLINNGTIIGNSAPAVQFGAGDDLLKLSPGASFTGLVDGGRGINTLELTAGTRAVSLTGLGTDIINFGTLLFDSGAQWTLAGTGNSGLGTIAITGFTGLDTIDLTDFAFASVTWAFANNALVLTNSTAAHDTLHIQGDFSTDDFRFASDGSGGTDIILGPGVEPIAALDTTTNKSIGAIGHGYSGPVADLQHEYIDVSSDNLNITTSTSNWIIHTGSGEDAIAVNSGTNVLDGGTGSNFLTGGSGLDTFFVE